MTSNLSGSGRKRFWGNHIARWNGSGSSQAEYCRLNKISLKSFQYWKRKEKRNGASPALIEVALPKLLSIPLSAHPLLCLVVDQHYRIEIAKGFDSEDLERVVRVLGRI